MMIWNRRRLLWLGSGLPAVAALALACTMRSTSAPASGGPIIIGAPASATFAAAAGDQALQLAMTDNKFSPAQISGQAGRPITVTLMNRGQGIHNFSVVGQKDANGSEIRTAFLNPGQRLLVTFTIARPGTYQFQCDVHPGEMSGRLTVS
jgi:plastocyanin